MDQKLFQTIDSLIEKSQDILILTHMRPDPDGIGAALALSLVLKELGKKVTVAANEPISDTMSFLPATNSIQTILGGNKDFVITLDCAKNTISKIKYSAEDNRFHIIITPKDGEFAPADVTFGAGHNPFSLIIVLDTGNLEHLGPLYEKNVKLFFETPVINIDHHASNTDFGQVNLVNSTAASTTEILYDYLVYLEKKMGKKFITADVATLLLAGLITDTGSFQHANTSPRSLEVAAELLDLGARQQEIVKNIFKTKKLSTLKLWGIEIRRIDYLTYANQAVA